MAEILREDPFVATRQDGNRARANAPKFGEAGGIFKDVDRIELNPTDREKLFEFQTTRSTRLPERFQSNGIGHGALPVLDPDYGRRRRRSSTAYSAGQSGEEVRDKSLKR